MTVLKLVRCIIGVGLFLAAIALPVSAQMYQGRELVKPDLLADTTAVVPGKPFTVGLLLHMEPHWHTYWKFSGDAGLPTEIKWQLPPGWKVGEIQWPIPVKLHDPGDIDTYGYENEVLLLQEITPPDSLGETSVKLSSAADWLVCERLCVPGSVNLSLTLPVASSAAGANGELFARYRALLPRNQPSDLAVKPVEPKPNERTVTLTSQGFAEDGFADFYPLPDEKTIVGHPRAMLQGNELTITLPFEGEPPKELQGLVVVARTANDPARTGWYLGGSTNIAPASTLPKMAARSLWTFLIFGFIGGFILNLMPCVLPVISLKIFGFIQHAGQDRRRILQSGFSFVAGIFVWFIGLAVLLIGLKAGGHQITWAAQFTNPYFVIVLSGIVLVFALDLFGVFEISLPQSVMHRMLHSADREGDVGSFFQGVFATALATPCTAPFLGTALGFAFTQSAIVILSMFIAVAAGMSAPYLLLCAQPGWLRFLPKPGLWMEHLKQFMGFLLLATLLFLLYVIGAQRGPDALIWTSCFLLAVSIACWIKGRFLVPTAGAIARVISFSAIVLLLFGGATYFIGTKFRATSVGSGVLASGGDWQAFTPERLQDELRQGHPVFIDFTAAWCITCKFNEASVLETAQVRDAFQRHGITKLRADWTNGDPVITKLLQQFGRPGVPLYVLYPGKSGEPIVFPELLTKGMLLDKLETITHQLAAK